MIDHPAHQISGLLIMEKSKIQTLQLVIHLGCANLPPDTRPPYGPDNCSKSETKSAHSKAPVKSKPAGSRWPTNLPPCRAPPRRSWPTSAFGAARFTPVRHRVRPNRHHIKNLIPGRFLRKFPQHSHNDIPALLHFFGIRTRCLCPSAQILQSVASAPS